MTVKGSHIMTPAQETKLNAATTWIPIGTMIALIIFAVTSTWWFANERAATDGRITQISNEVKNLASVVERLTETIGKPNNLAFNRQDWIMDCLRTQIANPNWKCIYADPSSTHVKSLQ